VNDDGVAALQREGIVDALQCGQPGGWNCAGVFQIQVRRNMGDLVRRNGDIFSVEAAFRIGPAIGIDLVSNLETADPRTNFRNYFGAIGAEHERKFRLSSRIPAGSARASSMPCSAVSPVVGNCAGVFQIQVRREHRVWCRPAVMGGSKAASAAVAEISERSVVREAAQRYILAHEDWLPRSLRNICQLLMSDVDQTKAPPHLVEDPKRWSRSWRRVGSSSGFASDRQRSFARSFFAPRSTRRRPLPNSSKRVGVKMRLNCQDQVLQRVGSQVLTSVDEE